MSTKRTTLETILSSVVQVSFLLRVKKIALHVPMHLSIATMSLISFNKVRLIRCQEALH